MKDFTDIFSQKINTVLGQKDPAHDLLHVKRVVASANKIAEIEKANLEVILPSAWLHDLVNLPKNHPQRKQASVMAADEALKFLSDIHYPDKYFDDIHHAICAHSFSSGISPQTIEAKIVQDADRLDALGAVGLTRLFMISAQLQTSLYEPVDPLAKKRTLDDKKFAIDHVYVKLKIIAETMHTDFAKQEAKRRFAYIESFLQELVSEI